MNDGPARSEAAARRALRGWVGERAGLDADELADDTALIASGHLTSLQVADLLLFVEELRGAPIDVASLRPGVFADIDTIYATFLAGDPHR